MESALLDIAKARNEKMMGLAGRAVKMIRGTPLTVLMYHAVIETPLPLPDYCFISAQEFAAQMDWLAERGIRVMPLVEAVSALEEGRLEKPTVAITFDDGYRNNVEVALPTLKRHDFPATIFLTTGYTDGTKTLWPCRLSLALTTTMSHELSWRGLTVSFADKSARANALARLQEAIKLEAGAAPHDAVAEIERALGVPVDPSVPHDSPFAMMDINDIATAKGSGLLEFGAHTVTHPILSHLDDAQLEREITGSIDAVEDFTGQPCCSFAYPNGRTIDFDDRALHHLSERGIRIAVTTTSGSNRRGIESLRIMRQGVGPEMSMVRLAAAVYGVPLQGAGRLIRNSFSLRRTG